MPRSRPTTSSTLRQQAGSRPGHPVMVQGDPQAPGVPRGAYSSTHSVLSAGSYQAAAAAAAAAVVAANARSRGISPGRGGTMQDVERSYVAAAASAAVNRAMARTPSPGPVRPGGFEPGMPPPTCRSVSPGREMRNPGFDPGQLPLQEQQLAGAPGGRGGPRPIETAPAAYPGAAWAGTHTASPHRALPALPGNHAMPGSGYHPSVAGSAATASDISAGSRPAGLTAAALAQLSGAKYPAGPGSPSHGSSGYNRHMGADGARGMHGMVPATDLPRAAAPQGWVGGPPQQGAAVVPPLWDSSLGSVPMELPHLPGNPAARQVSGSRQPHAADAYMPGELPPPLHQQQHAFLSSNGRGHYRSSSDGGGVSCSDVHHQDYRRWVGGRALDMHAHDSGRWKE